MVYCILRPACACWGGHDHGNLDRDNKATLPLQTIALPYPTHSIYLFVGLYVHTVFLYIALLPLFYSYCFLMLLLSVVPESK